MPSGAQYYPKVSEFSLDTGVLLRLFVCTSCGLHQLDSPPVSYYRDVIRPSGASKTIIDYRLNHYEQLFDRFRLKGKKIFECGCGQGEFLELWQKFPIRAVGIEHSYQLIEIASRNGLEVQHGFIDSAESIISNGPYDGFTSFNFLEHQPNPNGMLQGIASNLTINGCGLITVPNLDYILDNSAYYELIADHLTYFSRKTLTHILERNGFRVVDFDDTHEDILCAIVEKTVKPKSGSLACARLEVESSLQLFVETYYRQGLVAVWGASHQGFTILATANLADKVAFVIDSAPQKHGLFTPVSHLEIVPPERLLHGDISALIIIAPTYSEEIYRTIRDKYLLNCPVGLVNGGSFEIRF